jgi:hypothetical protein
MRDESRYCKPRQCPEQPCRQWVLKLPGNAHRSAAAALNSLRPRVRLREPELLRGDHARLRNRYRRLGCECRPDDSRSAFLFRCQGGITFSMNFKSARRDALSPEQANSADDLRLLLRTAARGHSQQPRVEQMRKVSLARRIVG